MTSRFTARQEKNMRNMFNSYAPTDHTCQEAGLLFYRKKLYTPDLGQPKALLLQEAHDNLTAGHPGRTKTYEMVHRHFYWPGMSKHTKQWVKNCHTCQRITPSMEALPTPVKGLATPVSGFHYPPA